MFNTPHYLFLHVLVDKWKSDNLLSNVGEHAWVVEAKYGFADHIGHL
jgi:hypothetical protein